MADIFLSYASEDRDRIGPLVHALNGTGWTVFWDREIPVGKIWPEVLESEITTCRSIVVVWSEASIRSKWVRKEANEGDRRSVLFPVRIDEVVPPFEYRDIQAANLVGWDGSPSGPAFRGLLKHLGTLLGKPPAPGREVEESLRREQDEAALRAREESLRQADTARKAKEAEERRRAQAEAAARKTAEERLHQAEQASNRETKVEPRRPLARPQPSRLELADLLGVRGPSISWTQVLIFLLAICVPNVASLFRYRGSWLNAALVAVGAGAAVVAFRYIRNPLIACVAAVLLAAPCKEALGLALGQKVDLPMAHMGMIALTGLLFWGGAVLGLRCPGPWWLGLAIGLTAGGIASSLAWRQWFMFTQTITSSLDWAMFLELAMSVAVSSLLTTGLLALLRRLVQAA